MIYAILKPLIKVALFFFCRKIYVDHKKVFNSESPTLIIANHPNSFLDAIIIAAYINKPIHFLARGDVFNKPFHRFLLQFLNMIPVYRISEGKEYLHLNEYAFKESQKVLNRGGIVLIFIEGICLLTNQLQVFKKGAARIALEYNGEKPLHILPLGIAYDRFKVWGKTVQIVMGNKVEVNALLPFNARSKNMVFFNRQIRQLLEPLIIPPVKAPPNTKIWIILLSNLGIILHLPLYKMIQPLVKRKTQNTVFYDSVLFGILLFTYPLYLLLVGLLFYWSIGAPAYLVVILFFLSARTIVLYKNPHE